MILRRMGNKSKLADKITKYFPRHEMYIEPFFGAGGMFFNKPKAKYNIMNDLDSDVFNLYQVLSNKKSALTFELINTPYSEDLFKHWMHNQETNPIKKAVRFLFLSNYSLYCAMNTMAFGSQNAKQITLQRINKTYELISDVQFTNCDFRKMFDKLKKGDTFNNAFCYADPPYLGTDDNYSNSFKEQDSADLFDTLEGAGISWAMSEFNHPFIIDQAKQRGLTVITIGERRSIGNCATEILVCNYKPITDLFSQS